MQKKLTKSEIERLKELKKRYPTLTRAQLAERFGTSIRTISRHW